MYHRKTKSEPVKFNVAGYILSWLLMKVSPNRFLMIGYAYAEKLQSNIQQFLYSCSDHSHASFYNLQKY